MTEKREDGVRKSPVSQVNNSRVRNSKDHRVLISLQLRLSVVRIFYRHRQLQVHKEVLEHKVKDCPRARSFTAPQTGGNVSSVQKGSKSVASPSVLRKET